MLDLISVALIGVFLPTAVIALIALIFSLIRSYFTKKPLSYFKILKVILYTVMYEVLSILGAVLILGGLFGKALGYAVPALALVFSLISGIFVFLYLMRKASI